MDLDQFTKDALRTESKVETLKINKRLAFEVIQMIISLGEILDQVKKNAFYNRPLNHKAINKHLKDTKRRIKELRTLDIENRSNEEVHVDARLFHSVVGITTESVELLRAIDLYLKHPIDQINIKEEFGDVMWYLAIGIDQLDVSWDEVLERVIAKLKSRYPDKYSDESANNRDLDTERKILEGEQI